MVTFDILGKHNNFSSIDDTEERKVALIAIYSNLSQEIIDEDDKFLKDALIEYFPPNEANDWLERPRVYGVKDLAGNDLDLKRRCVKIFSTLILTFFRIRIRIIDSRFGWWKNLVL